MDDSDDYFDDLVLDEGTPAALDEVETQFTATQSSKLAVGHVSPHPASRRPEPPPAKRQKIDRVPLKRKLSTNDYDDLPEISVQGDSYYQVNAVHTTLKNGVVYRPNITQAHTMRPIQARSSSSASVGRNGAPRPSQQLARRTTGPTLNAQPISDPPRGLQRSSSSNLVFGSQTTPRGTQSGDVDQKARRDAEILRVKLEELEKEQHELQQRLQAAEDARSTKEGEISILRASITKTSEQHAAEVARLQAAREAAEAAKLQFQKEQREELERLKTHYTFRQHELETSARKPPWSVTKRQARFDPNTPVKMPSQMRNWNISGGHDATFTETPRGPRFGTVEKRLSQRLRPITTIPEGNKRKATLPGFHNSFVDSPSRHLSQRTLNKGKGKQRASLTNDNPFFAEHSRSSPPSSPLAGHFEELHEDTLVLVPAVVPSHLSPSPPKSPLLAATLEPSRDEDVKMSEGPDDIDIQEETVDVDPPNWWDELHHAIFTHSLLPGKTQTMQILLNSTLSPSASPAESESYSTACSRLLETLGATPRLVAWEEHLREITTVFTTLARILNDSATIYPLSSLLSLLRILSYTIPPFTTALLSSKFGDLPPPILITLCDVIRLHLSASQTNTPREDLDTLAKEALLFIESLALTGPSELVSQLSVVIRGPKVLSTLLGVTQPTWLVAHTVRALGLLASHGTLFRSLITFPLPIAGQDDGSAKDIGRLPHIEQLSFYLIDSTRDGPEADQMRDYILAFIAVLALSHEDALAVLMQSQALIPSLILYLNNETNSFWEDDEDLITSPFKLDRALQIISRTITLLYYMVFTSPEPFLLNHKLHHTPHRQFNCIGHMFGVMMGRFSFADSPCWLNNADRLRFEQTVDMAKDLLEQVMEGPEMEDVWRAFQPDNEPPGVDDDDEEREARLLHPEIDN